MIPRLRSAGVAFVAAASVAADVDPSDAPSADPATPTDASSVETTSDDPSDATTTEPSADSPTSAPDPTSLRQRDGYHRAGSAVFVDIGAVDLGADGQAGHHLGTEHVGQDHLDSQRPPRRRIRRAPAT